MREEERSPAARARAESALVRLLHEIGDEAPFLVVLGGLVPAVLAADTPGVIPEHLGTTDIDILLVSHIDPGADLGVVERALEALQFEPDPEQDGWRWQGTIGSTPIRIEFLCDLSQYREGESIRPNGSCRLGAANLRGTGYVAHDFQWENITGALANGTEVQVSVRFAGLQGYLLSKCVALRSRAATKDYYDLAYVLLHNRAGGPEDAAQALRDGPLSKDLGTLKSTFLEVRERYRNTSDIGPRSYAEQAIQVDPQTPETELRADAVDTVQRFITALGFADAPRGQLD
ncbi:MAG: hypothetical protein ACHQCH_04400 [Solirubrobacterales bacterium]